ncbi:MAG: Fic family protein [Ekhidna sp.]|nr:Fic family protein [Ekhidna sp.]MBC6410834.1 Fic family protein [Ekhidna sp.]
MFYNWQLDDWKRFTYDKEVLGKPLDAYYQEKNKVFGLRGALSKKKEISAMLEVMILEAMKTSEIEGEFMSREDVMSSLKRNLGFDEKIKQVKDKRAQGIADLMVSVRKHFDKPLSQKMLFGWHTMLMRWDKQINVGRWRSGSEPMQVVSGSIGREKVHFEAPPSARVAEEMRSFIQWFNQSKKTHLSPIRAAIAHLYFESIHPFEDGNGRIGRAISEKVLYQGEGEPMILSISQIIESDKKAYYSALKKAQQTNEVTSWVKFFLNILISAIRKSKENLLFTVQKSNFLEEYRNLLNTRQLKVIQKMMDAGPNGFEGGMNARKYLSIAKTSKATATRDLQKLVENEVLVLMEGRGRSTSYELNMRLKK